MGLLSAYKAGVVDQGIQSLIHRGHQPGSGVVGGHEGHHIGGFLVQADPGEGVAGILDAV